MCVGTQNRVGNECDRGLKKSEQWGEGKDECGKVAKGLRMQGLQVMIHIVRRIETTGQLLEGESRCDLDNLAYQQTGS